MANDYDYDVYDIDAQDTAEPVVEEQPLYRIYADSKIAVGRAVGPSWKRIIDAAEAAYEEVYEIWEQVLRYYNNDQNKVAQGERGTFRRGDSTENVVFSNLNVMLPAVYSKDPDISCSTTDQGDEEFCAAIEALVNALFKRRDMLNAKPKIKKAVGFGLLTNFGILKLDFVQKDDSREMAYAEISRISDELAKAKTNEEVDRLYGELAALETQLETAKPSGPTLSNVLSKNLIIDPYAEQPDGLDADWQCEKVYLKTNYLIARFTQPNPDSDEEDVSDAMRTLVYKPTHKASFVGSEGTREDGLGMVLQYINDTEDTHTTDERSAYINMYYTECYLLWDKTTKRIFLFHRDDWTWPLWVWDDMLNTTRFFPYYIIGFALSTGGTVSVGETAYYLDQQDELNDINRQMAKIRRSVFDFWYYNSDRTNSDEVETFLEGIRGDRKATKHVLGVRAGEGKIQDLIESVAPPSAQYESLFNKEPILATINRLTNTSDALRGVQFKTNTNTSAIDTYQQSMQLSVGAKVDVVEDVVADMAQSLAEMAVQFYDEQTVAGIIGPALARGWKQMDLETFRSTYSLRLVAGSMEKPNSVFKKKEAVQIAQALGQFAQAAPGTTLKIMLRTFEQAFTDVVIKPEDWDALEAEVQATMNKGVSTGEAAPAGNDVMAQLQNLPPEVKQRVVQMKQQGSSDEEIKAFLMQQLRGQSNGSTEPARR